LLGLIVRPDGGPFLSTKDERPFPTTQHPFLAPSFLKRFGREGGLLGLPFLTPTFV